MNLSTIGANAPETTLPPDLIDAPEDQATTPGATAEDQATAPKATPPKDKPDLHDAFVFGEETPEMLALLDRPATFLSGKLYGARDHKNTQDGAWAPVTMPWRGWIEGGDATGGRAAWGFSRHPVGKHKEGACVVLGSSIGKARKAKAMEYMSAMGLDVDSGARLDDVLAKIEELGLFCLVYTSFNHGRRGLQLKRDAVLQKLQIKSDPTNAQVREYLAQHDKHRYEPGFIAEVKISEARHQTKEGVVIVLDTPPLDKFRLIFPLMEPVKLIDLADTQAASLEVWEDKITGLAVETLGVHFDTSCTDPSRLFYTGRHAKDAEDWYCAVVQGRPLRFEDIKPMKKSQYTAGRGAVSPWEIAGGALGDRPAPAYAPSGASLNDWHTKYKARFQIADLLETYCPDRIRNEVSTAPGSHHTECPFEHEHSSEGGTATMAVNAEDSQSGYWTWFCHHDACQGRHKLQMLEEALRAQWFDEKLLTDADAGFLLPPSDEEIAEEEADDSVIEGAAPADKTERHADRERSAEVDLLQIAEGFTVDTTDAEVRAFFAQVIDADAGKTTLGKIKATVVKNTALTAKTFNDLWKEELDKATKVKRKNARADDEPGFPVEGDYSGQVNYAKYRITEVNSETPRLFQFGGAYATADAVRQRIRLMEDRDAMFSILEKFTTWYKASEDSTVEVAPPESVVRALYRDQEFADTLPELLAVTSTPFFDADGTLVDKPGYHAGARVYLAPGGLVLPGVSREPTEEEMERAKRLLVEHVLADFPLAGMTRPEIVGTLAGENRDKAHAVAHAVATALLPFAREMINGPTPGHVFTKPAPGTGASLLMELLTMIACGAPAAAMELPAHPEEISKTISAALIDGQPVIFFDNVGAAIASNALAMAMTAPTYQARILGKSQTVKVSVRALFAFTANNVSASKEILRRLVLIPLDAGVPDPENRRPADGWLHPNLRQWVADNRADLVWACLTLVQNWVAQGMVEYETRSVASYENWSKVMGGILEAAGIHGFLEGQQEERRKAADDTDEGLLQLMKIMAQYPSDTLFRPGTAANFGDTGTVSIMDVLNGNERPEVIEGGKKYDWGKSDPIQINGWGYSAYDGAYTASGRIGRQMKTLARKDHKIGDTVLRFTEIPDTRNGTALYKMTIQSGGVAVT